MNLGSGRSGWRRLAEPVVQHIATWLKRDGLAGARHVQVHKCRCVRETLDRAQGSQRARHRAIRHRLVVSRTAVHMGHGRHRGHGAGFRRRLGYCHRRKRKRHDHKDRGQPVKARQQPQQGTSLSLVIREHIWRESGRYLRNTAKSLTQASQRPICPRIMAALSRGTAPEGITMPPGAYLILLNARAPASMPQSIMHALEFTCPVTGQLVQWRIDTKPAAEAFSAIQCPACSRTHLVNAANGRVVGGRTAKESQGPVPSKR